MLQCKSVDTPICTRHSHSLSVAKFRDPTLYRSIVGGLQYLTFTCPDLTYAVNYVCQHMHDPLETHWQSVKRILRYIKGTITCGFQIYKCSLNNLVAYSDADWAGCVHT